MSRVGQQVPLTHLHVQIGAFGYVGKRLTYIVQCDQDLANACTLLPSLKQLLESHQAEQSQSISADKTAACHRKSERNGVSGVQVSGRLGDRSSLGLCAHPEMKGGVEI